MRHTRATETSTKDALTTGYSRTSSDYEQVSFAHKYIQSRNDVMLIGTKGHRVAHAHTYVTACAQRAVS